MSDLPADALDELRKLYRALDRELASLDVSCSRCGKCCDFAVSGIVLYMGPLEAAIFLEHVPPSSPDHDAPGVCPFFIDGVCANRSDRFGCRTYFCRGPLRDILQMMHEKFLAQSRDLCIRFAVPWRYQSLTCWIAGSHAS